MNKTTTYITALSTKKTYKTPKINAIGNVRKLTLKLGSNVDGMGGFM